LLNIRKERLDLFLVSTNSKISKYLQVHIKCIKILKNNIFALLHSHCSLQFQRNSNEPCKNYSVDLNFNSYQHFEGILYQNLSILKMNVSHISKNLGQQMQGYKDTKHKKNAICYIFITYLQMFKTFILNNL
jgi:hypothetical protein